MPLHTTQLAQQSGVNPQSIRFYEREGLIPSPPRQASGYRLFPESTVARIRFIKRSQELGFSLAEIRELLALRVDKHRDRAHVRSIVRTRLAEIDARIRSLEHMRSALSHLAQNCHGHGPADECPILTSIDSTQPLDPVPQYKL